jgi:hypothetical protein
MKKNNRHPILFRLLVTVLAILLVLLLGIMLIPLPFEEEKTPGGDYSTWMSETLTDEVRIVDVAMPGSHDSLSYGINFFSAVDENAVSAPLQQPLLKGLGVRQSITQTLNVRQQLEAGVRYFDLRVTRSEEDGQWYGVHNYRSVLLADALTQFNNFLLTHPGEVVILDFQHCYDSREADGLAAQQGAEELYALLDSNGITTFMEQQQVDLATATYGSLTRNGARSAVLVLMKEPGEQPGILNYDDSISSNWYNTDQAATVFAGLDSSAAEVTYSVWLPDMFRVQQDVLTMQSSVTGILRGVQSWSLLRRAEGFNQAWLEAYQSSERESDWLEYLPIIMMDQAGVGETGKQVMNLVLDYNAALVGQGTQTE